MKSIKTLAETLTGCTVELGKTYYSKVPGVPATRSIKVYDLPEENEATLEDLKEVLTQVEGTSIKEVKKEQNYTLIRLQLPNGATWTEYECELLDKVGDADDDAQEPQPQQKSPEEILAEKERKADEFIATLDIQIGKPTAVPGYGIAVAFSEPDKEALKAFIKKVVMFGLAAAMQPES